MHVWNWVALFRPVVYSSYYNYYIISFELWNFSEKWSCLSSKLPNIMYIWLHFKWLHFGKMKLFKIKVTKYMYLSYIRIKFLQWPFWDIFEVPKNFLINSHFSKVSWKFSQYFCYLLLLKNSWLFNYFLFLKFLDSIQHNMMY